MEQDKRLAPLPTATPEKTCGLLGVSPSCHQENVWTPRSKSLLSPSQVILHSHILFHALEILMSKFLCPPSPTLSGVFKN